MTADVDTEVRPELHPPDALTARSSRRLAQPTGRRPIGAGTTASGPRSSAVEVGLSRLRAFYGQRSSRVTVAVTAVLLCYGGGGVMFWLHAIYRGEQGPTIAAPYHWLLDSTLGFVALSPVLFVLIPAAHYTVSRRLSRLQPLAVGAGFALVTTPGPVFHDQAVGGGTPLAQLATNVFGRDLAVAARNLHAVSHSASSECLLQLAVGLPVYVLLTQAAFALSAAVCGRSRRAGPVGTRPVADRQEHPAVTATAA